jgi:hypothetical protein
VLAQLRALAGEATVGAKCYSLGPARSSRRGNRTLVTACPNPFGSKLCLFFSIGTLLLDIRDVATQERGNSHPLNPMRPIIPTVTKAFCGETRNARARG